MFGIRRTYAAAAAPMHLFRFGGIVFLTTLMDELHDQDHRSHGNSPRQAASAEHKFRSCCFLWSTKSHIAVASHSEDTDFDSVGGVRRVSSQLGAPPSGRFPNAPLSHDSLGGKPIGATLPFQSVRSQKYSLLFCRSAATSSRKFCRSRWQFRADFPR